LALLCKRSKREKLKNVRKNGAGAIRGHGKRIVSAQIERLSIGRGRKRKRNAVERGEMTPGFKGEFSGGSWNEEKIFFQQKIKNNSRCKRATIVFQ